MAALPWSTEVAAATAAKTLRREMTVNCERVKGEGAGIKERSSVRSLEHPKSKTLFNRIKHQRQREEKVATGEALECYAVYILTCILIERVWSWKESGWERKLLKKSETREWIKKERNRKTSLYSPTFIPLRKVDQNLLDIPNESTWDAGLIKWKDFWRLFDRRIDRFRKRR